MRVALRNWFTRKRLLKLLAVLPVAFLLFLVADALFPLQAQVSWSKEVLSSDSTLLHAYLSDDDKWRLRMEPHELTPELEAAFLHKEDHRFYYHPGIDALALSRAAWNNVVQGKRTSGASTITMQVARMLNRKPRTYGNKLLEMFRALQLEWHYSKTEILQLYLSLAPYGGNIEGVKAASWLYFQKPVQSLSPAEIATLTVIPNRPNSLRPRAGNTELQTARNKWLARYGDAGIFSLPAVEDALLEEVPTQRFEMPRLAPHFSQRMLRATSNEKPQVHTTLNNQLQQQVQQLAYNYVQRLRGFNISNAAVLVVNNQTHAVEAYIGSADFHDVSASGQVDGIRAVRSPGSTLKPLVYGMAFDRGLGTAHTMVNDVRSSFSGYEPENYDRTFRGRVSLEFALANSLNVPAVHLLHALSHDSVCAALANAGFAQIAAGRNKLGLSLVLGGCGVRLQELVGLYSAFSAGGTYHPLRMQTTDSVRAAAQVLSPAATWMVTEILTQPSRPDLPTQWQSSATLPRIAWKTGTSYGRKDAWSIGYNTQYTVGVWVGNFSGEGVPELNGAGMASPLLFKVFNAIQYNLPRDWYAQPQQVDLRWVCSESGLPPASHCPKQVMDAFIPGVSNHQPCMHVQVVPVNVDSTVSYCTTCRPTNGYIDKLYPNHSAGYLAWLKEHNQTVRVPPPHNPDCERVFAVGAPEIVSPAADMEYLVDESDSLSMMLQCRAGQQVQRVFWYVNDRLLREADAEERVFFTPPQGRVKVSCTDDKGRNANVFIDVRLVDF